MLELEKSIILANGLIWVSAGWKAVKKETITKCFLKARIGENIETSGFDEDDALIYD